MHQITFNSGHRKSIWQVYFLELLFCVNYAWRKLSKAPCTLGGKKIETLFFDEFWYTPWSRNVRFYIASINTSRLKVITWPVTSFAHVHARVLPVGYARGYLSALNLPQPQIERCRHQVSILVFLYVDQKLNDEWSEEVRKIVKAWQDISTMILIIIFFIIVKIAEHVYR